MTSLDFQLFQNRTFPGRDIIYIYQIRWVIRHFLWFLYTHKHGNSIRMHAYRKHIHMKTHRNFGKLHENYEF